MAAGGDRRHANAIEFKLTTKDLFVEKNYAGPSPPSNEGSPHTFGSRIDKWFVSRFFDDAVRIFDTATAAPAGDSSSELNILIDACGGLYIVQTPGWDPDALRQHYGARTAYHVTRTRDGVQVDGLGPDGNCRLQSPKPQVPSLHLPAGVPQYTVVPARLAPLN